MLKWIRNKWRCFQEGHLWAFAGHTLGGDWIKCIRCKAVDEWLPGVHEPKGYRKSEVKND